jgi:hypothetical protein
MGPTFFVATYCFVPPFRKAKLYGVPSRAAVKVGYATGKKRLRNTGLDRTLLCSSFRLVTCFRG